MLEQQHRVAEYTVLMMLVWHLPSLLLVGIGDNRVPLRPLQYK